MILSLTCLVSVGSAGNGPEATAGEVRPSVVANGGFEQRLVGRSDPAGWNATRVASLREFHSFEWDDKIFHSGGKSVSISIRDDHPDHPICYSWNQAPLKCIPGERYELTGWIKARNLKKSASLMVQCWDRGMKELLVSVNTAQQARVVGVTDWVQVKATIEIPERTWRVVLLAGIFGHSNPGGKVWFDDIALTHIPDDE